MRNKRQTTGDERKIEGATLRSWGVATRRAGGGRVPLRGWGVTTANKERHDEWVRTGTIGEDALIRWFRRSSLLRCLRLPVVVKSRKCDAATANKSPSLTGSQHARPESPPPPRHHPPAVLYFPISTISTLSVCQLISPLSLRRDFTPSRR